MHKNNADALALAVVLKAAGGDPKSLFVNAGEDSGVANAHAVADFIRDFSLRLQTDVADEVTLAHVTNLLFR